MSKNLSPRRVRTIARAVIRCCGWGGLPPWFAYVVLGEFFDLVSQRQAKGTTDAR